MTPAEFAARIKAKYPDYAGMDDAALTKLVLAKHPEYASQVTSVSQNAAQSHTNLMSGGGMVPETGLPTYENTSTAHEFFTGTPLGNIVTGVAKGAGNTAYHLGELVKALVPGAHMDKGPNDITNALQPSNTTQSVAKGVEQVGEFLIPGMAGEKLTAAGGRLGLAGANALVNAAGRSVPGLGGEILRSAATGAGVSGAQGESPIVGGIAGAAGPLASRALVSTARTFLNGLVGAMPSAFKGGANPGLSLLDEGVMGASKGGFLHGIRDAQSRTMAKLNVVLSRSPIIHDATNAIEKPIDEALKNAASYPEQAKMLTNLKSQLLDEARSIQAAGSPAAVATNVASSDALPIGADLSRRPMQAKLDEWMHRLAQDAGVEARQSFSPEAKASINRLKFLMRVDDNLGFDSPRDAVNAILSHDDYATRWNVSGAVKSEADKLRAIVRADTPVADIVTLRPKVEVPKAAPVPQPTVNAMNSQALNKLRSAVDDVRIAGTGDPNVPESVTKALLNVSRNLNTMLDSAAPGAKYLNHQYGNLREAEKMFVAKVARGNSQMGRLALDAGISTLPAIHDLSEGKYASAAKKAGLTFAVTQGLQSPAIISPLAQGMAHGVAPAVKALGPGIASVLMGGGDEQPPEQTGRTTYDRGRQGAEWPKDPNSNDENNLSPDVNPAKLLPQRFTNARNITWGTPLHGMPVDSADRGLFGYEFDPKKRANQNTSANTALIDRSANDQPGTFTHELGHAIYTLDLTDAERQDFQHHFDSVISNFMSAASGLKGEALQKVASRYPKTIIDNFILHRSDPQRAYNEAFAELAGQYMVNPSAFKAAHPETYNLIKAVFGGKEYVHK